MTIMFSDCYQLLCTADDKSFKSREDFSSGDEYARYVRDCISMGMMVRCCEGYKEVRLGDIGRIMKVDSDGLQDLNVQANWQQKGGTYWVRFCHCELLGDIEAPEVLSFKPGDKVRGKRAVITPKVWVWSAPLTGMALTCVWTSQNRITELDSSQKWS
ncbi:E3 ubiquitin-protein ligase HERC2-like [Halichondria panicea]|uniref:E3 ubiquitin-protein ligase HERC2-like n=1 Tax=Halichondria panicea TaxID=6063 RepID=UPI00312B53B2